jgi:hypothetical protein
MERKKKKKGGGNIKEDKDVDQESKKTRYNIPLVNCRLKQERGV